MLKIEFEGNIIGVMPERINQIVSARQEIKIEGIDYDAAASRTASRFKEVKGSVVTVPLHGYISHKPSIYSALGMETSSETFAGWIDDLVDNKSVGAIILDVDSPGGTVAGISSVADKIYNLRGTKPIIAVVNDLMASAAYWLGSSADEIVANPEALTGSIGVVGMHVDYSKMLDESGIKVTYIHAGKYKVEGNPYEPITEEALAYQQEMVNEYYDSFVNAVARNRGISTSKVKADFGGGRVLTSTNAKKVGMIDRIASMDQVIERVKPSNDKKRAQAMCYVLKEVN